MVLGNVQNRIVSPDGENLAALPVHFEAQRLAEWLDGWRRIYDGPRPVTKGRPLPFLASVHQALNVAACDARPLILLSSDPEYLESLAAILRGIAWADPLAGRFHFCTVMPGTQDLPEIDGLDGSSLAGGYIVAPHEFGTRGSVIATFDQHSSKVEVEALAASALQDYAAGFLPRTLVEKFTRHVESGEHCWTYR